MVASTKLVGLDIGTTAVRGAEVELSGKRGQAGVLRRFAQVALPAGAVRDGEVVEQISVTRAIKQLWSEGKFTTKDVAIGVGNQRVLVRELDLPWMPIDQLRESLGYQVQDLLPVAQTDVLLDFFPTGTFEDERGRHYRGQLVAAQRDTVGANLLAVQSAGLNPVAVDLNGFALVRALAHGDLAQRNVAFVDIGASLTTVVITVAGQPRLVRPLSAAGNTVTLAVANAASISPQEADRYKREIGVGYAVDASFKPMADAITQAVTQTVESVRNTFVYFGQSNPGVAIDVVVLTGGGAHLPGLGQFLSSSARLPVLLGDALTPVRAKGGPEHHSGSESWLALSVGLASRSAA